MDLAVEYASVTQRTRTWIFAFETKQKAVWHKWFR